MSEFKAVEAPLEQDLEALSVLLWKASVPHRIVEEQGKQVLWVAKEADIQPVQQVYDDFISGRLKATIDRTAINGNAIDPATGKKFKKRRVFNVLFTPKGPAYFRFDQSILTILLIALSVFGGLIVYYSHPLGLLNNLTFQAFGIENRTLSFLPPSENIGSGEYWRIITPAFLHFSILHAVFNSLWLWELGRRIEIAFGPLRLATLCLLIAAGSNIFQYVYTPDQLFGGMSGVIYGLLGYCWVYNYFKPNLLLALPNALLIFMVAWLFFCMTDFMSFFGVGVANAAHLSGLILGLLLGLGHAMLEKKSN